MLGIILFGIPGVEGDGLKVKPAMAVKVHGSNDALESGNDVMCCCSRVSLRGTGIDGTCIVGGEEELAVALSVTGTEVIMGRAIGAGCFC